MGVSEEQRIRFTHYQPYLEMEVPIFAAAELELIAGACRLSIARRAEGYRPTRPNIDEYVFSDDLKKVRDPLGYLASVASMAQGKLDEDGLPLPTALSGLREPHVILLGSAIEDLGEKEAVDHDLSLIAKREPVATNPEIEKRLMMTKTFAYYSVRDRVRDFLDGYFPEAQSYTRSLQTVTEQMRPGGRPISTAFLDSMFGR